MAYSDDEDGVPCKTPSPRSSASQAPPNPRHNADEPPPRINLHATHPTQSSHPFKGLSRKFMSRSGDHKRGRSEGSKFDVRAGAGVYDTPNVRERVRRWQQAGGGVVLPGETVDVPPIAPATPTPGTRRGMPRVPRMDPTSIGLASAIDGDPGVQPLTPPRMPAIQDDWSSASETEKEAERQRTRSRERERKLRRRERARGRDSMGATPEKPGATSETPVREQDESTTAGNHHGDDGIRITPLKTRSKRKKRGKEKEALADETDDGGVRLGRDEKDRDGHGKAAVEKPLNETSPEPVTILNTHLDFDDGIRVTPTRRKSKVKLDSKVDSEEEPERGKSPESARMKVDAWDYEDGIRIYASKPNTPVKFTDRQKSVRQSAKSVKSRKEEFESDLKKANVFDFLVREDDDEPCGDDEEEHQKEDADFKGLSKDIEGSTIVGDAESARTKYGDYDDGIRVRPLKTKRSRRRRSPRSLGEAKSKLDHQSGTENEQELDGSVSGGEKPTKLTESAPATPTGGRLRRDTAPSSPYIVKDRVHTPQTRDFDSDTSQLVTQNSAKRSRSPDNRILDTSRRGKSPTGERSERKPRTARSGNQKTREERRAERRELRRQLQEDSEKFRLLASRRPPSTSSIALSETGTIEKEKPSPVQRLRDSPEVPARPRRDRKKTFSDHSLEDVNIGPRTEKNENSRSSDSLPLRKGSGTNRSTPTMEDPNEPRKAVHSRLVPASPSTKLAATTRTVVPADSRKKESIIAPQLSSFFKAVREEFSGKSLRADDAPGLPGQEDVEPLESIRPTETNAKAQTTQSTELLSIEPESLTDVTESESETGPGKSTENLAIASSTNDDSSESEPDFRRPPTAKPAEPSKKGPLQPLQKPAKPSPTKSLGVVETPVQRSVKELVKTLENKPGRKSSRRSTMNAVRQSAKEKTAYLEDEPLETTKTSTKQPSHELNTEPILEMVPEPRKEALKKETEEAPQISVEVQPQSDISPPQPIAFPVDELAKEPLQTTAEDHTSESGEESTLDMASKELQLLVQEDSSESEEEAVPDMVNTKSQLLAEENSSESEEEAVLDTANTEPQLPLEEDSSESEEEKVSQVGNAESQFPLEKYSSESEEETVPQTGGTELQFPAGDDSSALARPRRNLRKTTAPPRPKSLCSRTESDVSASSTSPITPEDTVDEPARTISDASTVKPLRYKKADSQRRSSKTSLDQAENRTVAEAEDWYNPDVSVKAPSLRRKYTKHADLMSVLSVPKSSKSLRSAARSRRSKGRKRVQTMTIDDLLKDLLKEEVRYMRELRTLVEDVVPVLFQTVLGRADDDLRRTSSTSSVGTSRTGSSQNSRAGFSSNPTRPIVDMGISLERLRTVHERIPVNNTDKLMAWANDAKRVYEEYLSVWRMGFQDVVVTMSPDEDARSPKDAAIRRELEIPHDSNRGSGPGNKFEGDPSAWAMPPPPNTDDEGAEVDEKVDVAFLLKRPLVRLKVLAKLFKRIDYISSSPMAASLSTSYHALVTVARRKISEEKARIEDEAAASLDVSRAFDLHLLVARGDVILDQTRRVKARDSFEMRLYHSSGQLIERKIEVVLRDPSSRSRYSEGEVLFVEIGENYEKWLLFPPVPMSAISARTGDAAGEIVIMIRGLDPEPHGWREVIALASSTAAGFEWVQMLGLVPIPPEGPFTKHPMQPAVLETVVEESTVSSHRQTPVRRTPKTVPHREPVSTKVFESGEGGEEATIAVSQPTDRTVNTSINQEEAESPKPQALFSPTWLPPDLSAGLRQVPGWFAFAGGSFTVPEVNMEDPDKNAPIRSSIPRSPSLHTLTHTRGSSSPEPGTTSGVQRSHKTTRRSSKLTGRDELNEVERPLETDKLLSRSHSVHMDDSERPEGNPSQKTRQTKFTSMDNVPVLSPTGVQEGHGRIGDTPPPVPPHRTPTTSHPKSGPTSPPNSDSSVASVRSGFGGKRRTSSPLKHEYDPSSPSNSDVEHSQEDESETEASESETSSEEDEDESDDAVSLCSEEDEEDAEYPLPMLSIPRRASRRPSGAPPTPGQPNISAGSAETLTLETSPEVTPFASQVTMTSHQSPPNPQLGIKFRVFIFKWATNQWAKIPPGECKMIITPGHIEAYPLVTNSPTNPTTRGDAESKYSSTRESQQELIVAFDLTPTLSVRRGTAVDISIRTPATSKLAGASIMLRSRSPNECENLYNAINNNRNYPPEIQLPSTTTVSSLALPLEIDHSETSTTADSIRRGFGAWARSKTYRAGTSTMTPSLISSPSETSVNSISSAFSRFRPGRIFKNSPLSSLASTSSSMGDSSNGTPIGLPDVPGVEQSIVIMTPMKVRLYRRENGAGKWRDLGRARLHVFKPHEGQRGRKLNEDDKRIVVTNKKGGTVHLDVVLGESAFERVARTGVALSVLTGEGEADGTGKPGESGGIGAKSTVYMMQMKGEAEAAYSFSVLGKLRY